MKKIDYSFSQRLIALLLCVVMLLPSMLMQGFAAEATPATEEESVTAIALSDYQNSDGSNTKDTVNYTFSAISSREIDPNSGTLTDEEWTQVQQVIALIDEMPSAAEIDAKLMEYEDAGDLAGQDVYFEEVWNLVRSIYAQYFQLSEEQKACVTNADKLLELEYMWADMEEISTFAEYTIPENFTSPVSGVNTHKHHTDGTELLSFDEWRGFVYSKHFLETATTNTYLDAFEAPANAANYTRPNYRCLVIKEKADGSLYVAEHIWASTLKSMTPKQLAAKLDDTTKGFFYITNAKAEFTNNAANGDYHPATGKSVEVYFNWKYFTEVNYWVANPGFSTINLNVSSPANIGTKAADDVHATLNLYNYDETINDYDDTPLRAMSKAGYLFFHDNVVLDDKWGDPINPKEDSVDGIGGREASLPGADPSSTYSKQYGRDMYGLYNLPVMEDTLDPNGFPQSEKGTMQLYFDPNGSYHRATMENGGGLFRKDSEGYWWYDSVDTAAYYDQSTNRFKLYNCSLVPAYTIYYSTKGFNQWADGNYSPVRMGNFLPFNDVNADTTSWLKPLIDTVKKLDSTKTATDSNLTYSTQNYVALKAPVDNWFGMTMDIEFYMPEDGKINGQDMIFDFHGDDDVFVYIGIWDEQLKDYDYRLVLDIGGTHGARSGNINFATGAVQDRPATDSGKRERTLKEIFNLSGDTFEDYTNLKLKFYYMERGGNISYCRLRFNLPTLPQRSLPVGKTVEATSDPNKFILTLDAYATGDELEGVMLDENLVMKEVLSDYVQLDADATVKYLVYTQDYLGNGQWGDLVSFNGTVETTTKNGRVETVEVSGFDYGANFVMETPRVDPNDSSNTAFRGRRLVLKVYIETREGFWGGNNVPTNKSTTAIYSDGEVFKPFPVPEINVPIDVTVDVVDKTIYYDGSLDSDGDGKEGEELIHQVTIGGKEVEVNEDGSFTPAEDWMDDFAQASWDENSTTPGSDLSNTQPHDYTYTVVVTPNSDGTTNQSPNPGNIAGNVDGGTVDPEDLTAPSQSAADTGHVFVLAPEIIFQDSTTDYGTPTEGYDYEGKDYVDTNWVYMEDDKDTANAPEVSGEEPQLDLSYTASDENAPEGCFVTDTQVEVTVTMNGKEITDIVNFGWQDNCSSGDHTDSMDVPSHMGNETSNEFWVHVLLKILPDTVVVDFGLPVEIHVLVNDKLGDAAELIALGAVPADLDSTHELRTGFLDTYASGLGAAEIKNDAVVYTPSNMQMDAADVFAYAVKHTKGETATYYYGTVTVVPATMIYYEDDFVDFTGTWETAGEDQGGNQGEDRPGEFEFPEYDADHIYGYDPAYDNSTTYSLGSARYASVSSKTFETDGAWPTAKFTFTGTGFDLISLTSNQTGFITCRVYKGNQTDTIYESWVVDTYYGYSRTIDQEYPWVEYTWTYNGERWTATKTCVAEKTKEEATELPTKPNTGDVVILYKENYIWTPVDSNTSNDLYQIPVIKSPELDYGIYTVVITPTYIPFFDHTGSGGYDFYLDAVRIYAPAENMEDYYLQDGEAYPQYVELRKQLLTTDEAGNATGYVNGISFIDGVEEGLLADYDAYGPNNEIYLNPNQAIAFAIDSKGESIANVHVGVKIFDNPGTLTAAALDAKGNTLKEQTITTTSHTDLYYSISNTYIPVEGENISNVIVLTNTGSSPITLTTLKITYGEKPTADSELVMDLQRMQAAAGYVERKVILDLPVLQELQLSMGHSVNFESDLQMNYRIKRDALEGYDLSTAYLVVEKDVYPTKGEATVETYTLYPDLTSDAERMIFRLTGIQAAEMGSELRATLHIRDTRGREVQSNADTYSILAYAKLCFERYSYEAQPAMYRLLMDSLNYGAAAQLYFGRRTDSLVNAGLEAYQQYATTELAEELNDSKVTTATIQNAPVSKLGFSVSFTDKTELNVKLTLTGSTAEITSVRVTDESGNLLATLSEFTELPDGRLQTTYTGILATQLRQMFYFTAYSGEEAVSATCGYSVEAYARSCIYGSDQDLAQLVRSCMYYGDSALAYFAEKGAESN